jgi:hypothetical protein
MSTRSASSPTSASRDSRGPNGRNRWHADGARPSWSARPVTTASTGSHCRCWRRSHRRAVCGESRMRRSGWGPPEKDPLRRVPRWRPTSALWHNLGEYAEKAVVAQPRSPLAPRHLVRGAKGVTRPLKPMTTTSASARAWPPRGRLASVVSVDIRQPLSSPGAPTYAAPPHRPVSIGAAHAPDTGKTSQLRDLASGVAEGKPRPSGCQRAGLQHTAHIRGTAVLLTRSLTRR